MTKTRWQELTDYQRVQRFLLLSGRPFRPRAIPTRPRPTKERTALLALIPGFSFRPLSTILEALGHKAGDLQAGDHDLGELQGAQLAREVLGSLGEKRDWIDHLHRAHEGLVRERPPPRSPDLIAIPGSRTLSRAAAAFRLWRRLGSSARVAVSGGRPSYADPNEDLIPEAEAYSACLRLWGVPEDQILREDQASSTAENAAFLGQAIAEAARARGRPIHLLLVTTGFHTTRLLFSVRRLQARHPDLASINIAAAPSFHPETLAFDEGGRSAASKIAIVLNEYLKLHFEITRSPDSMKRS